jgi:hypothetical protein
MTDEARIERLTELARRVWPDVAEYLRVEFDAAQAFVRCAGGTVLLDVVAAGQSLDALEAALLVLAGEGHISYSVAAPGLTEKLEALTAPYRQPAWVEQLASCWEERARNMISGDRIVERCAAELRERAREKP